MSPTAPAPAPKPAINTPPAEPCLDCARGLHTCDPIMQALGVRFRTMPGLSVSELEALVEHLDQFI